MIRAVLDPRPTLGATRKHLRSGGRAGLLRLAVVVSLACAFWLPRANDLWNWRSFRELPIPWELTGLEPELRAELTADLAPYLPWLGGLTAVTMLLALMVGARASGQFVLAARKPNLPLRAGWRQAAAPTRGYLVLLLGLAAAGLLGRRFLPFTPVGRWSASALALTAGTLLAWARDLALPLAVYHHEPFPRGARRAWSALRRHPAAAVGLLVGRALAGLLLTWTLGILCLLITAIPTLLAGGMVLLALRTAAPFLVHAPDWTLSLLSLLGASILTGVGSLAGYAAFLLYAPAALALRLFTLRGALLLGGANSGPPAPINSDGD